MIHHSLFKLLGLGSSEKLSVTVNHDPLLFTNLSLSSGEGDVHETAGVCESLLRATLWSLLLLLWLNLSK